MTIEKKETELTEFLKSICSSGSLNCQWLRSQRTPLTMWLLWKAS